MGTGLNPAEVLHNCTLFREHTIPHELVAHKAWPPSLHIGLAVIASILEAGNIVHCLEPRSLKQGGLGPAVPFYSLASVFLPDCTFNDALPSAA